MAITLICHWAYGLWKYKVGPKSFLRTPFPLLKIEMAIWKPARDFQSARSICPVIKFFTFPIWWASLDPETPSPVWSAALLSDGLKGRALLSESAFWEERVGMQKPQRLRTSGDWKGMHNGGGNEAEVPSQGLGRMWAKWTIIPNRHADSTKDGGGVKSLRVWGKTADQGLEGEGEPLWLNVNTQVN